MEAEALRSVGEVVGVAGGYRGELDRSVAVRFPVGVVVSGRGLTFFFDRADYLGPSEARRRA